MNYMTVQDIESVLEITGLTMEEMADELGVSRMTLSNWINKKTSISKKHENEFYEFVFKKGIRLNKIKEQFYREDMIGGDELLLFHGAKTEISGELDISHSKMVNDFGSGFYCGENLEQSVMFVASHKESSLYMLKFNPSGLKSKEYSVDKDWMLTVAYYRKRLEDYKDTDFVRKISSEDIDADYIVAPIADNRMFEIIDSFIDGEITDVQCQHCLSATNLGMQYIFKTKKAFSHIEFLEKCFLTEKEKDSYLIARQESFKMNQDKVKLVRKQYRNKGKYIEDILK